MDIYEPADSEFPTVHFALDFAEAQRLAEKMLGEFTGCKHERWNVEPARYYPESRRIHIRCERCGAIAITTVNKPI